MKLNSFSASSGTADFGELDGPVVTAVELASAIGPTGPPLSGNIVQAKLGTNQTVPNGSDTVVQFADDIDPNNWWNASSYRFQPTVSGYYRVYSQVWWVAGATGISNQTNLQLRKNGTSFAITQNPVQSESGNTQIISQLVSLNGSTDYVDVTV